MKRISTLLPILAAGILVSCGQSREVYKAPSSQQQAGLIATCTTAEEAQALAEKHNGFFRVLNKKARLVELIGIDQETIEKEHPRAKLYHNEVHHHLLEAEQTVEAQFFNEPYQRRSNNDQRSFSTNYYFPFLQQIDANQTSQLSNASNVVIAIIDSGVDYTHPHLNENIFIKSSEWQSGYHIDGIDGDGNGRVDDAIGWDFVNNDAYPMDDNNHGTHVAGLAAGKISGVAPHAKILPVKVLDHKGTADMGTIAAGVLYAVESGAHIINLSLGGSTGPNLSSSVRSLLSSLEVARQSGILMVAASGNGGDDNYGDCNDSQYIYPANANNDLVITVASVNERNQLSFFSNYGQQVDIAAPGSHNTMGGLRSTVISNCFGSCPWYADYAIKSGTSMSTPLVSGLAANIKGLRPDLDMYQVRNIIYNSATYVEALENKLRYPKVINAALAYEEAMSY